MVCDIRGFSTMSEVLPEEHLARMLGEWFRDAGEVIHASGGTIDNSSATPSWPTGRARTTAGTRRRAP